MSASTCDFAFPVACVAAQEHFWWASNSSQPKWKWTTFLDIVSPLLQFPHEKFTVLITNHAAVVEEEIQVGMKHVYL